MSPPDHCIKAHSPLPLGLVSPDRKFPPASSEACLLPTTAISVTSPTLSLPQVISSSPSGSPMLDLYRLREEYVELGLNVVVVRLSLMVLMACVPYCGSFTTLVRVFTACCRIYTDLSEYYVAMLEIISLCLQKGPNSLSIVTLPGNLVPLDIRCPLHSVLERSLLPITTLESSGSITGKLVLLEAEAKMCSISRLASDGADDSTSTSLEAVSLPFWTQPGSSW